MKQKQQLKPESTIPCLVQTLSIPLAAVYNLLVEPSHRELFTKTYTVTTPIVSAGTDFFACQLGILINTVRILDKLAVSFQQQMQDAGTSIRDAFIAKPGQTPTRLQRGFQLCQELTARVSMLIGTLMLKFMRLIMPFSSTKQTAAASKKKVVPEFIGRGTPRYEEIELTTIVKAAPST